MHLYYCLKRNKRDSEALFRHVLGDYLETGTLGIPKQEAFDTIIRRSEFGKPYLPLLPHIKYSVSHSGDCWGCLFSSGDVGLDIEDITNEPSFESDGCIGQGLVKSRDMLNHHRDYAKTEKQDRQGRLVRIAERFFSVDEIDFVHSSPNYKTLITRFYLIWTRKEAYIKYTGRGIGAGLSSFSVMSDIMGEAVFESIDLSEGLITACCYNKTLSSYSAIKLLPLG